MATLKICDICNRPIKEKTIHSWIGLYSPEGGFPDQDYDVCETCTTSIAEHICKLKKENEPQYGFGTINLKEEK